MASDENLTTLLEGILNASSNFGYDNQSQKFDKSWCSLSRLQGCMRLDVKVLNFTTEDIYPLMDEVHQLLYRIFVTKSSDNLLLTKTVEFYEEFYKRKKILDLFETGWGDLHYTTMKLVSHLKEVAPYPEYYWKEVEELSYLVYSTKAPS